MAVSSQAPTPPEKKEEPPVEVVFRQPPPPPPPAPPPTVAPPPARVARAAPPRPKGRVVAALIAPKEVPKELPPPSPVDAAPPAPAQDEDEGVGDAYGDPNAPVAEEVPEAAAPVAVKRPTGPIHLPENGEPAVEASGNTAPQFPQEALKLGKQAVVVLRIVISASGAVGNIQVLKGEEPFIRAAIDAVTGWRYQPARLDGQPISVYRIVKVPFVIRN